MSRLSPNSTRTSKQRVAAGMEPARVQFIERSFADLLGAGDDREGGRQQLVRWMHQRIFVEGAPVSMVRLELHRRLSRTRVFTVTSGKGGVGKTTFAVNLALGFGQLGLKVLLCDADLGMANVHVFAGLNPSVTLLDVIDGRAPLARIVVPGPGGIEVVCGASGIGRLADMDPHALEMLGRELLRVSANYDVLVVDTGAGIANSVMHFLGIAQDAIAVATPNLAATLDAYGVIKLAREQYRSTRMHLLVNHAESEEAARATRERIEGCTRRFLQFAPGDLGWLARDDAMERANQSRRPLVLSHPEHVNAQRIVRMAAALHAMRPNVTGTASDPAASRTIAA